MGAPIIVFPYRPRRRTVNLGVAMVSPLAAVILGVIGAPFAVLLLLGSVLVLG